MPKKRLASEGVAVIELEIVSFAKPHHWRRSGAIVDFAGFELFEEKFFESCDFGVEVFTWSQEKPDDEGFEQSDTDVSVGLTGRFSADIDPVDVILYGMVDGRQEIVHDKGGVDVLPGIVDAECRKAGELQEAFEREKAGFYTPTPAIQGAKVFDGVFFQVGQGGEQHFCFSGGQFDPDKPVFEGLSLLERNAKGAERPFGTHIKRFANNELSFFGSDECLDDGRMGEGKANQAVRTEIKVQPGDNLRRKAPVVNHEHV